MHTILLKRKKEKLSKTLQIAILRRDAWLCCYCKRAVVFLPAMKLIGLDVGNAGYAARVAHHHPNWTPEALLDEPGAAKDQIKSFSAGKACSQEDLYTTCWKCALRRGAAPIGTRQHRKTGPAAKAKYQKLQGWDGLASMFVMLADRNPAKLTAEEKQWLKALKSVHPERPVAR